MLARSGEPLRISAVDHVITNAISIAGSRGHLGGAFDAILKLYANHLFDPGTAVTSVLEGVDALHRLLAAPDRLIHENCKVLVKLKPGAVFSQCTNTR